MSNINTTLVGRASSLSLISHLNAPQLSQMDRLEHYRQCIQKLLIEDSKIAPINGEIEVETIFDTEKDRYLAVDLGWDGHRRVYNCVFHLDIKNGKIWIQRNQTDRQIADELVEMGVPKEDIVLGLQPTYAREHTGFGVA